MIKKISEYVLFIMILLNFIGCFGSSENNDNTGVKGLEFTEKEIIYFIPTFDGGLKMGYSIKIKNNSGLKIEDFKITFEGVEPIDCIVGKMYKGATMGTSTLISNNQEITYKGPIYICKELKKVDYDKMEGVKIKYSYYYNDKNDFYENTSIIKY